MSRGVAVLGSTGSIGRNTLEVIRTLSGRFHVTALAAGANVELLAKQVHRTHPRFVSVADKASAERLRARIAPDIKVGWGAEALVEAATHDGVDTALVAVVGARGVRPTLAALQSGKRVALANKEALVAAGELVDQTLRQGSGSLIPVDSEHSAILQCLQGEERAAVDRIILTASGGPFRNASLDAMAQATPSEALKHPTWSMGGKITVDSATLMNKGLEVIEARWLFDLNFDRIDVVVHPQSIVHSLVEFVDGCVLAQLGAPDMRAPIQYALCFPERIPTSWSRLSFAEIGTLTFEPPDKERFPCLQLAYAAGKAGGTAPAVLNAANEVAVESFLSGHSGFPDIVRCVESVLSSYTPQPADRVETVMAADAWARREARAVLTEATGGAVFSPPKEGDAL